MANTPDRETSGSEIAVIGMSGRFPGAASVEELWENLVQGRESIEFFAEEALRQAGVSDAELTDPNYVRASPILADVDLFDAEFFHISPREAKFLDPQHRLFLECALSALEDAGCDPSRSRQRIGVFAGASVSTYLLRHLIGHTRPGSPDLTAIMFGNAGDFLPSRLSYKLDLKGPSVNVQTACSTSLVAVHLACQNLLAGESDIALAGGVTVQVPQKAGYLYERDSILSPDGHCRPFDTGGRGTVFGSGLGVVVLKRLEDAIRDRDRILAVVLGSAVNNDGSGGKMGYMAPSIAGQTQVLADALSVADVAPESIGYVEAHGTGTALGDPIEIASLAQIYGADAGAAGAKRCAIGAAKANVGHLDIAAGVLGFIKTVMILERGRIPPVVHFEQPNPALELGKTPFYIPARAEDFPDGNGTPRRAAVSSFGIGGTNAHVILEEAPPVEAHPREGAELLVISAKSKQALEAATDRLAAHLEAHPDVVLGDVAHTLAVGRQRYEHRRFLVASSVEDAVSALRVRDPKRLRSHRATDTASRLVFMFPGQGSQYPNMARALYERDPAFRADVERVCGLFERATGQRLLPKIYPAHEGADAAAALDTPETVQLVAIAIELAMAQQLERWGLRPSAVVGHSLGEYAAAFVAGVLSLEDVVTAVAKRSRAMAASAPGGMLAVSLPAAEASAIADSELDVAVINTPSSVVLSGHADAIARAEAAFAERGVEHTRLRVPRANHSRTMDAAAASLRKELAGLKFAPPRMPFMSAVTGAMLNAATATDPGYWADQVRKPVRFADAFAALGREGPAIFVEVGPGGALSNLVREQGGTAIATLPARRGVEEAHAPLGALGELWLAGVNVDFEAVSDGKRRRVALPTYPFQRKRYWVAASRTQEPEPIADEPPSAEEDERDDYIAPTTDSERLLCQLFEEMLHVRKASVSDDFFDLGGHSLLAMRLLAAVRRKTGVQVALEVVFQSPTIAAIARAVDEAGTATTPIPRADRTAPLPLSFSQERLFFLDQLEPGMAAYNITFPLRIRGPLDESALSRAFGDVVARHESLSSRFELVDGNPVQRHDASTRAEVDVVDAVSPREVEAALASEATRPFDLARGPVVRARLLRSSETERLLLLSMHHIVTDGWSFNVLLRELAVCYRAHARGQAPSLPPLDVQYGDFAAWQRSDESTRFGKALAFWREELRDAPLVLELPVDRPRAPQQSFRGGSAEVAIPPELLEKLEALARTRSTTLFVVLLTSFFAWLSQHTQRRDIVVGTTVAGRTHPATEDLIGLFINALPIRAQFDDGARWVDLLEEVKRRSVRAFQHQDVPFEHLVRALGRTPDLSRPPIFQVDFLFNNFSADEVLSEPLDEQLALEPIEYAHPAAKYEMTLEIVHKPGNVKCRFEYCADLFDEASVRAMAARWVGLLSAMVATPEGRIDEDAIVLDDERRSLVEWQGMPAPRGGDLVSRFDQQAHASPSAAAIGDLTYAELRARSEAIAAGLAERGIGLGDCVGIDGPITGDLVAAILGILRRGAAYVPFDPTAPSQRVDDVCQEAAVRLVVTSQPRADLKTPVVAPAALVTGGPSAPALKLGPETVAYVIYTSGTTGRPKGVVVPHGAVSTYVAAFVLRMGLRAGDRVLQLASLAFDLSVEEVFGALTSGATLVLRSRADDLTELLASARRERISLLDLPTPLWHEIVDGLRGPGDLWPELRHVVIGADKADPKRVERWRALGPTAPALHDTYGPTETTIVASWARLTGAHPDRGIGRPVPGVVVRILGPSGRPVPPGVVGEIGIAGSGVAHGYLGRPELTAERFVPDPLGTGQRLYRTGDLGRWTRDGCIEILGRTDHQIKLRGYRIELGEIEAAILALPGIAQCVVKLWSTREKDPYLAAYVVADDPSKPPEGLKAELSKVLPAYMVPRSIVFYEALPKNERGKIDRQALPESASAGDVDVYVAPRTPLEERVAEAYRDVLGTERVSVHDSFFALGGNSLSAMRLVGRLREALSVTLPMTVLFDAPVVEALAKRIEGSEAAERRSIPRLADRAGARLSFSQERLFFLEQFGQTGDAYHISMALRVEGRLDAAALSRAVLHVMDRHEVLRARFTMQGEIAVQDAAPVPTAIIDEEDAPGLSDEEIVARAEALARVPFTLSRGCPVRATLFRRSPEDHVIYFTMHHIVSDGWSMGILVREVGEAYVAYARGATPALPPLPIQFADYASWQRTLFVGEALESELSFWRSELQGASLILELPTDRPRPAVATSAGGNVITTIDRELVAGLHAVAADLDATLYMVLLAGYFALLSKYSGSRDIIVGVPVAGRSHPDMEGLIGMFVNSLPVRAHWERGATFGDLVAAVKARLLRAFDHQDVPLAQLVEALQAERDTSRTPLFQTLFVLQNAPVGAHDFGGGLRFSPLVMEMGNAQFELSLDAVENADGSVVCTFNYNSDLFDRATAERMVGVFEKLLAAAARDRAIALERLTLDAVPEILALGAGERQAPSWGPLAVRMAKFAETRPEAIAVREGDRSFTYAAWEAVTNQLAHRLRARGIGPEKVVGVSMPRSPELVASVWAARKAGGAYVALDPELPDVRLATMARDAGAAIVLVAPGGGARWQPHVEHVIELDLDERRDEPTTALPVNETAASLSYVLFTSGSTGLPKGTMNTVAGITNQLEWGDRAYAISPDDVVLQKTPYSFDVSVWELYGPLAAGATLEVARAGGHRDPRYLIEVIEGRQVTVCHFVPSMLSAFLDEHLPGECRSLRLVVCGGEALTPELTARFRAKMPWAELGNLYGPTECAIGVTYLGCGKEEHLEHVSLGRPVWNTRTHVFDDEFRLSGRGIVGELCAGGVQVGRGYLGRPELTAERFVPDPHSPEPGARMYRTGDLARWNNDGEPEYLGRMDYQIKLRGFRIELGEIEAALRQQPGVKDCAVILYEPGPGEASLAAYIVPFEGEAPALDALRAGLAEVLPSYMVPTTIDVLDRFPLTNSGKTDRRSLPKPQQAATVERVLPRTDAERRVAEIFAQLLQREDIGALDNFFILGGHSLMAMQLVSRLRDALGIRVRIMDVYTNPTVEGLARIVEAGDADVSLTTRKRDATAKSYRLSFAQERLFFIEQLEPGSSAYHAINVLRMKGTLDESALEQAVALLVHRHEVLRTRFGQNEHGTPVQWIDEQGPSVVSWVDARELSPADLESEMRRVSFDPFDLATGPLLRVAVFRRSAEETIFACAVHHIVFDGWSFGIFLQELSQSYGAFARGDDPQLPPLPTRYVDYAAWQRESMEGGQLASDLAFWSAELAGSRFILDLPADRTRPVQPTFAGGVVTASIAAADAARLRSLAQTRAATPFVVLLAAFYAWLSKHAATTDIVVGTPVAGRTHPDTEPLIGFFVNTLPLRARWDHTTTFVELVDHVKATVTRAFEHPEVPLAKLVEALNPERDRSRSPLFQVTATMDVPLARPDAAGLELTPYALPEVTSPFDLSMAFREEHDGSIAFTLNYSSDLFDRASAERMLQRYVKLLSFALRESGSAASRLPLDDGEFPAILELGAGDVPTSSWGPVATRMASMAKARPDVIAVREGERSFTYATWEALTNQLAHRLRALGTGPEKVVGVSMDRSAELVASVWAARKTGGAYVALAPDLPDARLFTMAGEVGASIMLVARGGAARWKGHIEHVIEVDLGERRDEPTSPLPVLETAANLSYVLYTSGSTGLPKGTMNTVAGLGNQLEWGDRAYAISPDDVVLQKTPYSFDVSVWELYGPLAAGATLEVARAGGHRDPRYLIDVMEARKVTVCHFVPSMLVAFLDEHLPGECQSLRLVVCGGEALTPELVARFRAKLPWADIGNLYGPTECAIGVTYLECPKERVDQISLGRPVWNTRTHVFDDTFRLSGQGIVGELCLGGIQVGRGYLDRPELTAERYVPDPHSPVPGARMYRTGDLARWNNDGALEYLGRMDHQIKLRGFRIELGEIEAKLTELPEIAACVVVLRKDASGYEHLAAYVVPAAGAPLAPSSLREALGRNLPSYMIPTTFTVLPRLPLNANGKVDRAQLPVPEAVSVDGTKRAAPRTPTEVELVKVWREALGRDDVGVLDDFFQLGGHSLVALTLLRQIERQFEVRVPLAALFEEPTIERMGKEIDRRAVAHHPWLVPLQVGEGDNPLFFLPAVAGDPRHLVVLMPHLARQQPVYGLFATWRETLEPPPQDLAGFAAAYLSAIRSMRPKGPYRLAAFSAGCATAWEMALRLLDEGEEVEQLVLIDGQDPGTTDEVFVAALRAYDACFEEAFAKGAPIRMSDLRRRHDSPVLTQLAGYGLHPPSAGEDPVLGKKDHALVRLCRANMESIGRARIRRYPGRVALILGERNEEYEAIRRGWLDLCEDVDLHVLDCTHEEIVFKEPFISEVAKVLGSSQRRSVVPDHELAEGTQR
jgi:amino acid adenylation domain-containing protein